MTFSKDNNTMRNLCIGITGLWSAFLLWVFFSVLPHAGNRTGLCWALAIVTVILMAADFWLVHQAVKTDLSRAWMITGWVITAVLFVLGAQLALGIRNLPLAGSPSGLGLSLLSFVLWMGLFIVLYWTVRTLAPAKKHPLKA